MAPICKHKVRFGLRLAAVGLVWLCSARLPAVAGDGVATELLWPNGAPGAVGSEDADKPSLSVFQPAPDKACGAAVVVCPGGGYGFLAADYEGSHVGA